MAYINGKKIMDVYFNGYETADDKFSATSEAPVQNKVISNGVANALKGNKIGSGLSLDDISPIEHELKIKVMSKNLVPYPYDFTEPFTKHGITYTPQTDGGIKVSGTLDTDRTLTDRNICLENVSHLVGKTLCLKDTGNSSIVVVGHLYYNDGTSPKYNYYRTDQTSGRVKVTPENASHIIFGIMVKSGTHDMVVYPQLEIGTTPTEYTRWEDVTQWQLLVANGDVEDAETVKQYFNVNQDGTVDGAKSMYPTTKISHLAEGQNPTVVECEYNRDLNKAFAELQALVLSNN